MVLCSGTEGYIGSLFRNGRFHWFSVMELKVSMVNYLEIGEIGRASCRERV